MDTPIRTRPWSFGGLGVSEIGSTERDYVLRVLAKRRLFRYTLDGIEDSEAARLESVYRDRTGAAHVLAVNGGTSALGCALAAAGIGPGDEVIVPAYTYIATAAAVVLAGAVPVIVDIDDTLTMDPAAFEAAITDHTAAVIPVHMRGVPAQIDELVAVAHRRGLAVVEDVAQANGGSHRGRALGTIGDIGCFSFQQSKLITAGEGGLVITDSRELATRASVYHDCAFSLWDANRSDEPTQPFPGQNFRMSEVGAAIALAQTERLDGLLHRLRSVKSRLVDALADTPGLRLQRVPDPAGDVSYSLILLIDQGLDARTFSKWLAWEGIRNDTVHNNGLPDRHIFTNWDYVLAKRGVSAKHDPWTDPRYHGSVDYSPERCRTSLDILARAVGVNLHQTMDEQDIDDIIAAVTRTARRLGGPS